MSRWLLLLSCAVFPGLARAHTYTIGNGDVTGLINAINDSNGNGEDDTIVLAFQGTYTIGAVDNTTKGQNGLPVIASDGGHKLLLNGAGATIERSFADNTPELRLLYVGSGADVILSSLILSHGHASSTFPNNRGGGIYNDHAKLTLNNCALSLNTAPPSSGGSGGEGGGIYNDHGTMALSGSNFSQNTAGGQGKGGGITNSAADGGIATLSLTECSFTANSAGVGGGAIANISDTSGTATLTMTDCTLSGNSTTGLGGGVYSSGIGFTDGTATATLTGCTFDTNSAAANGSRTSGGAIHNDGTMMLNSCTLSHNSVSTNNSSAYSLGGAIANAGSMELNVGTLNNNTSGEAGGAVYNQKALTITGSNFVENVSGGEGFGQGGAVFSGNFYGGLTPSTLFVADSNFNSNSAGAKGGAMKVSATTMSGCTFAGNHTNLKGGAFYTGGSVWIIGCGFDGNYSLGTVGADSFGGAIYNDGESANAILRLRGCTFGKNVAYGGTGSGGGAIYSIGRGGSARTLLDNCTLSENSSAGAGGAIFNNGDLGTARVRLANCTFSKNSANSGGAVASTGLSSGFAEVILGATLLQAGTAGGNLFNNSGTVSSLGYNLSDDNGGGFLTAAGDQISTNPGLDSAGLLDNGGPTMTIALRNDSPALDQGKNFAQDANSVPISTDQRDETRPIDIPGIPDAAGGDGSDIGAYEAADLVQDDASLIVNLSSDHDDGICGSLDCTLREAIDAANTYNAAHANAGVVITFDRNAFEPPGPHTIDLLTALPVVASNIQMQGPGAKVLTVQRSSARITPDFRIFAISNGTSTGPTVTISGLTLANGHPTGDVFADNSGGAIYNDHGTLTVQECVLQGNSASSGGAIYSSGVTSGSATLTVLRSTFSGNIAVELGGGIFQNGFQGSVTLNLLNSTLTGNSATSGGGVWGAGVDGGHSSVTARSCTLSGNSATFGGGIGNVGQVSGTAALSVGNTILSSTSGANLYADGGTVTSEGYNLSSDGGGGFLNAAGDQISTEPKLDAAGLKDNGGPTSTLGLQSASSAIDHGNPAAPGSGGSACPTTDQRGFSRPVDGPDPDAIARCDAGAFEFGSAAPTPTPTVTRTATPTPTTTRTPIGGSVPSPAPPASSVPLLGLLFGVLLVAQAKRRRKPSVLSGRRRQ